MFGSESLFLQHKAESSNRWRTVHVPNLPRACLRDRPDASASPPPGRQRGTPPPCNQPNSTKRAASTSPAHSREHKQTRTNLDNGENVDYTTSEEAPDNVDDTTSDEAPNNVDDTTSEEAPNNFTDDLIEELLVDIESGDGDDPKARTESDATIVDDSFSNFIPSGSVPKYQFLPEDIQSEIQYSSAYARRLSVGSASLNY